MSKILPFVFLLAVLPVLSADSTLPTLQEIRLAEYWVDSHWNIDSRKTDIVPAGLTVLANHDPVRKNRRGETPLNISGTVFSRGLYVHANSHVRIVLPQPAKKLTATLGIDSNPQTSGGRGSVIFIIKTDDKEVFRSERLTEGMKPVSLQIDIGGVREFDLIVNDAGDGISCDQSDWADVKVELADGTTLFLDELPFQNTVQDTGLPFSFQYGDINSVEFLKQCRFTKTVQKPDATKTQYTLVWFDDKTKLETRMVGVQYHDFPVVEWTLYFKNTGTQNTPILANINAADLTLPQDGQTESVLHHHIGSPCTSQDYRPLETRLRPGERQRFSGTDGRPSDQHFPYFSLANGTSSKEGGTIAVVGWSGQWEAVFSNINEENRKGRIHFRAGQEQVHTTLFPGEEIRSPMIALLFWNGERLRSQNVWRRWFIAHNAPKIDGKIPKYHWTINTSPYYWEMVNADTQKQIMFIDGLLERGLFIDYWWMDAGWYVNDGSWGNTGTWEVDQKRFPGGLRPISDHANAKGVKTLVWFEPERVTAGTWLTQQHPDWVLGGKEGGLLNLGHPDAQKWLVEHIDGLIRSEGIGLYRQDFNIAPLGFWRRNDAPDRQGITENKHVCGYLAFWDELRRRHPNMSIDSCASGGRRNDLETLRRAIILHRSDNYETTGNQGQSFGLASWTPLFGIGAGGSDQYHFRSMTTPFQNSSFDVRDEQFDFAIARKYQADWKRLCQYYAADYYPLTPYSTDEQSWVAWQYNSYDGSSGIVQIFKRPESIYTSARLKLYGLAPDAAYTFDDFDGRPPITLSGHELMEKGLPLTIEESRVALILEYHK
ncbi:MAG: NPCBM/NEW2 domain-containing protein [Planctomycetaceae bacterium]|jgi:alpha-galactosidase|nr:NPCBM/NEW2 domain-containing protein [Planctomycetaceae bacterium]